MTTRRRAGGYSFGGATPPTRPGAPLGPGSGAAVGADTYPSPDADTSPSPSADTPPGESVGTDPDAGTRASEHQGADKPTDADTGPAPGTRVRSRARPGTRPGGGPGPSRGAGTTPDAAASARRALDLGAAAVRAARAKAGERERALVDELVPAARAAGMDDDAIRAVLLLAGVGDLAP